MTSESPVALAAADLLPTFGQLRSGGVVAKTHRVDGGGANRQRLAGHRADGRRPAAAVYPSPQISESSINSTHTVDGAIRRLGGVDGRNFPQAGEVQRLRPAVGLDDDGVGRELDEFAAEGRSGQRADFHGDGAQDDQT